MNCLEGEVIYRDYPFIRVVGGITAIGEEEILLFFFFLYSTHIKSEFYRYRIRKRARENWKILSIIVVQFYG